MKTFYYLSEFLASYLNEDWKEEYQNIDEAVNQFVKDSNDPAFVKQVVSELSELLNEQKSDAELRKIVQSLGCAVFISGAAKVWLEELRTKLAEANEN